jgi:hypothetical protein
MRIEMRDRKRETRGRGRRAAKPANNCPRVALQDVVPAGAQSLREEALVLINRIKYRLCRVVSKGARGVAGNVARASSEHRGHTAAHVGQTLSGQEIEEFSLPVERNSPQSRRSRQARAAVDEDGKKSSVSVLQLQRGHRTNGIAQRTEDALAQLVQRFIGDEGLEKVRRAVAIRCPERSGLLRQLQLRLQERRCMRRSCDPKKHLGRGQPRRAEPRIWPKKIELQAPAVIAGLEARTDDGDNALGDDVSPGLGVK